MMKSGSDILLATLNSTYQHTSFGLRYLYANLGAELQPRAQIMEWTIQANTREIAEKIVNLQPRIVGLGVYIWNTTETLNLVRLLKKIDPSILIVLGGPEVSHEFADQEILASANYLVLGEGDFLFRSLCEDLLLKGEPPVTQIISGTLPEIKEIKLPYAFYSEEDVKNRVIYVEASRGCPYKCEYCLSSLDKSVRNFPVADFLTEMKTLLDRGVRQFKFVDRTFNLSQEISSKILEFFLEHIELGLFLHFELVPDRLPEGLKLLIQKFPEGSLQFEIGVQTWSPEVAKNISRNQNYDKIKQNFGHLIQSTKVHIHADLIVGLPGETVESFGHGFNELARLAPHEIQVGLLKRLKGTPITKKESLFGLVYQDHPPFQILKTNTMPFEAVQKLDRFARVWNLIANQGRFSGTIAALQQTTPAEGWFDFWWRLTDFLSKKFSQFHGVHPDRFAEALFLFCESIGLDSAQVKANLIQDYQKSGSQNLPLFLREKTESSPRRPLQDLNGRTRTPSRQNLHLKTKGLTDQETSTAPTSVSN